MSDNPVRKLTVTGCREVYSGTTKKNKPYKIYEVQATDEHGQPVQQTLKSFDQLEVGLTADFEVERYDGGQHGISYTLKRLRPKLGPRVEYLEDQVIPALEARIARLEQTAGLQPQATTGQARREEAAAAPPPQPPPPQQQPPQQQPPAQGASIGGGATVGGDDDIPF